MAETKFTPLDPQQLEGPFSGFLRPQQPQQQQTPPGPVNTAGGIAMLGTAFLKGAADARIKNFEQRENEKVKNLNTLQSYVQSVVNNPDYTDEAKQFAIQQFHRALGGEILGATGSPGKGSGKKGKGEGEQQGPQHHFTNILKDIATGMVGGKMPKGAQDVNVANTMKEIYSKISAPEYSKKSVVNQNVGTIETTLKDFSGTQEQALAKITPHLQAIEAIDPQRANAVRQDYLGRYHPEQVVPLPHPPTPGSREWLVQRAMEGQQSPGTLKPPLGPPEPFPISGFKARIGEPMRPDQEEFLKRLGYGDTPRTKISVDDKELSNVRVYGPGLERVSATPAPTGPPGRSPGMYPDLGAFGNMEIYGAPEPGVAVGPDGKTMNVTRQFDPDSGTYRMMDQHGIPLPEAMQSGWQFDKNFARPLQEKALPGIVMHNGAPSKAYVMPNGEYRYEAAYIKPDNWREKLGMQIALTKGREQSRNARADARTLKDAESKYLSLKSQINRTWDLENGKVSRDTTMQPADKQRTIEENNRNRAAELKDLESSIQAARSDLRSGGSPQDPPQGPPKTPASKESGATKLTKDAKSILPF